MSARALIIGAAVMAGSAAWLGARPDGQQAGSLAITHVTVLNADGAVERRDQTVLISGNRIVTVAPAAEVRLPGAARVVDGSGKYLIPGLWDMHTHVLLYGPTALKLLLAHGVTGIRDMGAERFGAAKALRDSIAAGLVLGPRMRIASPVVENPRWLAAVKRMVEQAGTPWRLYERFGPRSPEEAVRWVDSVAALGADHIKVRNWPDTATGRALLVRAEERGLPVVAHPNEPFPRTGVATYEHYIWPSLTISGEARDSLWKSFASRGAAFVPTLVTWPIRLDPPDTLIARLDAARMPGLQWVPPGARTVWRDELLGFKQERGSLDWREIHTREMRNVREMHEAGITLLAGTDLGAPLLVPGVSLHDELELLVRAAGLTPLEALRAATLAPARAVGLADSLGLVEVGKVADLVLLDADPRADIRNTQRINGVIANGRLLERRALDAMLREVEEEARPAPR